MSSYIKVHKDKWEEITREADPSDSWDRDSTSTSHSVTGLELVTKDGYLVHEVPYDAKVGNTYWLVYAVYSTGDSFGQDDGAGFEIIGIYDTREMAEQGANAAEGTGKFINENGEEYENYRPWDGYFESLDSMNIKPFTLMG